MKAFYKNDGCNCSNALIACQSALDDGLAYLGVHSKTNENTANVAYTTDELEMD